MKRVFLAGEGRTELGDWQNEPQYRANPPELGVLEALLLRRVGGGAFAVQEAIRWTKIPLYKAGDRRSPESRRIRGLAVRADEGGCDVLVFSRDRDGDEEREERVEQGIAEAVEQHANLAIAGGVAVEMIEAWLLALLRERKSEELTDPKSRLRERGECQSSSERSALIEKADLDAVPEDACSLRRFLSRVDAVFAVA